MSKVFPLSLKIMFQIVAQKLSEFEVISILQKYYVIIYVIAKTLQPNIYRVFYFRQATSYFSHSTLIGKIFRNISFEGYLRIGLASR